MEKREEMHTTHDLRPQARIERLVVQELEDEVLVYDLDRHRAHSLNQTATLVWRHCDGQTPVTALAAMLHREIGVAVDEDAIHLALERLGRAHLLQERLPPNRRLSSRRELVRRLAMVGGLALVTSIVAPEAQAAGSLGGTCSKNNSCFSNHCCCCNNGVSLCTTNCDMSTGGPCDLACRARGSTVKQCNGC